MAGTSAKPGDVICLPLSRRGMLDTLNGCGASDLLFPLYAATNGHCSRTWGCFSGSEPLPLDEAIADLSAAEVRHAACEIGDRAVAALDALLNHLIDAHARELGAASNTKGTAC